jgi:hypothetical protein
LEVEDQALYKANAWPDCLNAIGVWRGIVVSERVVEKLRRIGIISFGASVLEVMKITSDGLSSICPPRYLHILAEPGIQVQIVAGRDETDERWLLKMEKWSGADVVATQPPNDDRVFCTRRVIELARSERWSNFRFNPSDMTFEEGHGFDGIDYLGSDWPPAQWYSGPSQRSPSEWLKILVGEDQKASYQAHLALLKVGSTVVPELVELLRRGTEQQQVRVSYILRSLGASGTALPADVALRVEDLTRYG